MAKYIKTNNSVVVFPESISVVECEGEEFGLSVVLTIGNNASVENSVLVGFAVDLNERVTMYEREIDYGEDKLIAEIWGDLVDKVY